MRFPTAVIGEYQGFKDSFDFTGQDGSEVKAPAKLQFLTRDEQGRAELLDVREKDWQKAGGPRVGDIEIGTPFRLNGHAVTGANFGRFSLSSIEAL